MQCSVILRLHELDLSLYYRMLTNPSTKARVLVLLGWITLTSSSPTSVKSALLGTTLSTGGLVAFANISISIFGKALYSFLETKLMAIMSIKDLIK